MNQYPRATEQSSHQGPPQSPWHRGLNIALKILFGTTLLLVPFLLYSLTLLLIGALMAGYCYWSAYVVWRGRRRAKYTAIWAGGPVLLALMTAIFIQSVRHSSSGYAGIGNLGAIRSALSIYYGDMEGVYPSTLESLTVDEKYLPSIPKARTPPDHGDSRTVTFGKVPDDTGGWLYNNDPQDKEGFGTVMINCTHTNSRGSYWASY